jgi:hypothetical protein
VRDGRRRPSDTFLFPSSGARQKARAHLTTAATMFGEMVVLFGNRECCFYEPSTEHSLEHEGF